MTSRERLESLASCGDAGSLRSALNALCSELGAAPRIEILTVAKAEKRQALCFLRLESAVQEQELIAALGAARFGADLLVVVDLPK